MLRIGVIVAALAVLLVPAGRSAPPPPQPVCTPLPKVLQGDWQRLDNRTWVLQFFSTCTFRASERGTVEGDGAYNLTGGDETAGTFVFSDDMGCTSAGVLANAPTPYDYTYAHGVFTLTPEGEDLCYNPGEAGSGRAASLAGHGGWIRSLSGRLKLALKKGSFTAKGVFADHGRYAVVRSRSTKTTKTATVRFTGANGAFTISERIALKKHTVKWSVGGTRTFSYTGLVGEGKGTVHGSAQSLSGDVNN